MAYNPKYDLIPHFRDDTQTWEDVPLQDLGIASTNSAEIGGALADADTVVVYDASASLQKTSLMSRISTYVMSKIPIVASTWTPTLTAITNLDSVANGTGIYIRIGAVVLVAFYADIDPTAAGVVNFQATLPVASNFAGAKEALGVLSGADVSLTRIASDSATDKLNVFATAAGTASSAVYGVALYQVI